MSEALDLQLRTRKTGMCHVGFRVQGLGFRASGGELKQSLSVWEASPESASGP